MTLQPPLEGLIDYQPSERTRLVLMLAEIREEWQQAISGRNILETKTSVGLLLNDVANKLQLTPQERHVFLGSKLVNDIESFLAIEVTKKLTN